jgi:hypothetical protein
MLYSIGYSFYFNLLKHSPLASISEVILRRSFLGLVLVLLIAGCSQFDAIPYRPIQTPETWLRIQPYLELHIASHSLIIIQPTTSALVYALGIIAIGAGLYFLGKRNQQRARLWWGVALLLWGAGALLAGTSYEAFSYQIKCAGRTACIWTSAWEIGYLILSVASLDAMLLAQAYACVSGKWRRGLALYALINFGLYVAAVSVGVLVHIQFLMSFELLLIVTAPNILIFFILNGWRYRQFKQSMDRALLGAWAWLALTIAAYFIYLISGLTQTLWAQRLWFSENDVLHIGLIVWMFYLGRVVAHHVVDQPALQADHSMQSV